MVDEIDHDNPEWTVEDFARAEPAEHLPPEWLAAFPRTAERLASGSIGVLLARQAQGARVAMLAA